MHTYRHTRTHANTRAHTRTHTHTHKHTRTHTHTHTLTQMWSDYGRIRAKLDIFRVASGKPPRDRYTAYRDKMILPFLSRRSSRHRAPLARIVFLSLSISLLLSLSLSRGQACVYQARVKNPSPCILHLKIAFTFFLSFTLTYPSLFWTRILPFRLAFCRFDSCFAVLTRVLPF